MAFILFLTKLENKFEKRTIDVVILHPKYILEINETEYYMSSEYIDVHGCYNNSMNSLEKHFNGIHGFNKLILAYAM